MKNLERVVWLFLVAILIFMLFRSCNKESGVGKVTIQTTVKYDTIQGKTDTSYIPQAYAVIDTLIDSIPYPEYITLPADYFPPEKKPIPISINLYSDTLKFGDSLGFAVVKDTVAGKILKRGFDFKLYNKIITTKETVPAKQKLRFYVGPEYQFPSNYLGGAVAIQFKNDNILKASFGYAGQKQYGISYLQKIKLR